MPELPPPQTNAYLRQQLRVLSRKDRKLLLNKNWARLNRERLKLLDKEDSEGLTEKEKAGLERLQDALDLRRALGMRIMMKVLPADT
jgi:hypothetical protein